MNNIKLFDHQQFYLNTYWNKEFFGLLWSMGTGKSAATIAGATKLFTTDKISAVLIIAPNGVHTNWIKREIPKFCITFYDAFAHPGYMKACDRAAYDNLCEHDPTILKFYAINIEALSHESGKQLCLDFIMGHHGKVLMIVDESSTIKTPGSKRTKAVLHLGRLVCYRRILTGTPLTQSPFDIWSQAEFLKPGIFGKYFQFTHRYAIYQTIKFGSRSFQTVKEYQNLSELRQRLLPFCSFIRKDDVLDLPPKLFEIRDVPMTQEQLTHYKEMKNLLMTEFEKDLITATNGLHKLIRLHQITLGFLTDDNNKVLSIKHNRLIALKQILDESDGQLIIFTNFRFALLEIENLLVKEKISHVVYHGDIPLDDRQIAIDKFQAGQVKVFLATVQTAGFGLTLTKANLVVYYSNGYSLERRVQSEDRAHRIGTTKPVTYIDLVSPKTVDEHVLSALMSKSDIESNVTNLLRKWITT